MLSWDDCAVDYGMTPERLEEKGKLLFGKRWQTNLARALRLADASTIRKWRRGKHAISGPAIVAITALLLKKKLAQMQERVA